MALSRAGVRKRHLFALAGRFWPGFEDIHWLPNTDEKTAPNTSAIHRRQDSEDFQREESPVWIKDPFMRFVNHRTWPAEHDIVDLN